MIQKGRSYDCVIPRWNNQFTEPLFAIYPVEKAFYTSADCIKKRELKLTNIINTEWKIEFVSIEDIIKSLDPYLSSFKNVNTNRDIAEIERLF